MAHFARVEDNIVRQVIVVNNEVLENKEFPESEPMGIAFCKSLYGEDTQWLQTSYNSNFRGHYAGVGTIYNPGPDSFSSPQPFTSWTLDANSIWQPPVPMPEDGSLYKWDEATLTWVVIPAE